MEAIVFTGYGDVDKLELRDVHEPKIGPDEIKVRVAGPSNDPIDWKIRSGALTERMSVEFPTIMWRDASGEAVEVGAGVSDLKSGVRVIGLVMGRMQSGLSRRRRLGRSFRRSSTSSMRQRSHSYL
jgi:NADPH:quinone reductase-like Zn-dependent oxidoreductase